MKNQLIDDMSVDVDERYKLKVKTVAQRVNMIFNMKRFRHIIEDKIHLSHFSRQKFNFENASEITSDGQAVIFMLDKLSDTDGPADVRQFHPKGWVQRWKYRKTRAMVRNGKQPVWLLKLSLRSRRNGEAKLAGTLFHEVLHIAGFGHGNNRSRGKQNAPPYWCGKKMMQFYLELFGNGR